MKRQGIRTIYLVSIEPSLTGAIGPGHCQPMQHTGEDRTLNRKSKTASLGQSFDDLATPSLFPQSAKDHRNTDTLGGFGLQGSGLQTRDEQSRLCETCP